MTFPTPPEGHAIVIANVQGRLLALDLILTDGVRWEYSRYGSTAPGYTRIAVEGVMVQSRFYDPNTGQTHDAEQQELEAPRGQLGS